MKYYSKMLDGIEFVCKWLMIISLFFFSLIIIVSVFCRYVLQNSLTWAEQVSRFLFVWVIMMVIPIIYREKIATNLDLVTEHFPPVVQKVIAILMDMIVGGFAAFYGYAGLRYTLKAGRNIFQGLNIPAGYIYVSEVICGAFLLLCAIESILNRILEFNKPETAEKGENT